MSQIALNKSSLKRQRDQLSLYRRVLPSLDLKRQQLATEAKAARGVLADIEARIVDEQSRIEGLFAILGGSTMQLGGLVRVGRVEIGEENVVGTRLPVLRSVECIVAEYSTLAKPFWVDFLVEELRAMVELRIRASIARERVTRLDAATRRTTQRVNLFDKLLIPRAQGHIKRIGLALSEQERSAVVRSKLAKRKE